MLVVTGGVLIGDQPVAAAWSARTVGMHEWSCHEIAKRVRPATSRPRRSWRTTSTASRRGASSTRSSPSTANARSPMRARWRARAGSGPLAGVPFAPKDLFDTAGMRTTYGSALFRDHVPTRTATRVQRLVDAGADHRRQGEPARVRLGRDEQATPSTGRRQSARARSRPRRIVRRQRRGASPRGSPLEHRHGHRRLDPHPLVRLRDGGLQAQPRTRPHRRLLPARALLRSRRTMASTDGGVRAGARGARGRAAPYPRLAGLRIGVLDPIARHGSPRGLRRRLRGGGAAALGARAARSSPPSARSSTATSTPSAATSTRPTSSASWRRASSCPPVAYRALGRGRRLASALRARAALRRARLAHADVRPAARRGGGDARLPRPRDRPRAAVQLARLALGDDARRRLFSAAATRPCSRRRSPGNVSCRPRRPLTTAAGSCPPSR